jgi:hypothetical protein
LAGTGLHGTVKDIEDLKIYDFYNALSFCRELNKEE